MTTGMIVTSELAKMLERANAMSDFFEYMLASPAWQALDGNSRALYIELARRYRGPNSNNGRSPTASGRLRRPSV
jgi:hypothetical protein